jgi:anti-sigma factor ChrR (cupin superfamily)
MSREFIVLHCEDLPWEDGSGIVGMPHIKVKMLQVDEEAGRRDFLILMPAGFHEPRHSHTGSHVTLILEGRQVINEGELELGPGDYVYGPADTPHGPFDYPVDTELFVSFFDDAIHLPAGDDLPTLRR